MSYNFLAENWNINAPAVRGSSSVCFISFKRKMKTLELISQTLYQNKRTKHY